MKVTFPGCFLLLGGDDNNQIGELKTSSLLQGFVIFGEDWSKVPCVRNSFLYAFSASCLSGIVINLATSRNTLGMSLGVFGGVLAVSW